MPAPSRLGHTWGIYHQFRDYIQSFACQTTQHFFFQRLQTLMVPCRGHLQLSYWVFNIHFYIETATECPHLYVTQWPC